MADEPPIVCVVCGTANPPTATDCRQCGIKLAGAGQGAEVARLLEELTQAPVSGPENEDSDEEEGLDLDKEIVDELLDSLLLETSAAEAGAGAPAAAKVAAAKVEMFECPMCGTEVAADAPECPKCHTKFAALGEAPPEATSTGPELAAPAGESPAMAVSEGEASKVGALSGRLIDLVVAGTTLALVGVFAGLGMWSWARVAANPSYLIAFLLVALGGFGAGIVLFKLSTSAIAQGDRLVKEGRYEESIAMYDRAIRMGSRPAMAWTAKGVAYKRLGRLDEAVRCHNAALKQNPKNEIAWCNKGDILFRAGRLETAIGCFDRAIEIRPKYAIAWNNKGAALARMGRFEDAKACQDRAVALKPRYVAAWLNRGEVLARLGDRDEAQRCLDRAKALGA
ncbi:MAG: tetratricopeptide repeat protein [Methanobacteriota archaeon]|nr:MAG: tetratricopeptide repeat protein [Euryarchaeota archaeon]